MGKSLGLTSPIKVVNTMKHEQNIIDILALSLSYTMRKDVGSKGDSTNNMMHYRF